MAGKKSVLDCAFCIQLPAGISIVLLHPHPSMDSPRSGETRLRGNPSPSDPGHNSESTLRGRRNTAHRFLTLRASTSDYGNPSNSDPGNHRNLTPGSIGF